MIPLERQALQAAAARLQDELATINARLATTEPAACHDCRVRALGCAGCPENPDAVSVEMPAFLEATK